MGTASNNKSLATFTDSNGLFKILALDHVNGLKKDLASVAKVVAVPDEEILKVKALVLEHLIADVSGVLLDMPAFRRWKNILPSEKGVFLKLDDGWTASEQESRITKLFDADCVRLCREAGAQGVKLMLYYRHDAPETTRRQQESLVERIAEECKRHQVLFCLEPWWYPMLEDERGGGRDAAYALGKRRPELAITLVEEFSKPNYGVDIFKLDFPVDIRYMFGQSSAVTDSFPPLYDVETARQLCARIGALVNVPWTLMSSGISEQYFEQYFAIGIAGYVGGYVCGQTLWGDIIGVYPDYRQMNDVLRTRSLPRLKKLNTILDKFLL